MCIVFYIYIITTELCKRKAICNNCALPQEFYYLQKCILYENRRNNYAFILFVRSTEEPYGTTNGRTMVRNERKMSQMHSVMRERREASLTIDNKLGIAQNEGKYLYT